MHADIVANSTHHEKIVVQVSEERRQILDILVRQEKEILESSEERQRLKAAIDFGEEQAARAAEERRDLVYQVHKQQQDVRKIVDVDLSIIPKGSADELGPNELVDEVVKRTVAMLAREGPNGEAALKQEEKKEEPEQRSTFARPSVITNPAEEEMIDRIEAAREALTSP
jgi:septal ring factor EnvC (AmiA/AmiB activator)